MYSAIGNRARQDEIRDANPDGSHCRFLLESPWACDSLPRDIGSGKRGCACPNNPWEREPELLDTLSRQGPLLDRAHYVERLVELGLLPGVDELDPEEFLMATIMRDRIKRQEMEFRQVGLLKALFGGNKN